MRMHGALLLAAVLTLSPRDGVAEEKQIVDVKELAGSWRGWIAEVAGDEWATMNVSADGSYKASALTTTNVGRFYLQAGKLRIARYERRRQPCHLPRWSGTASVSEDQGKTVLTLMPEDPNNCVLQPGFADGRVAWRGHPQRAEGQARWKDHRHPT
jgi:hypothetical protein